MFQATTAMPARVHPAGSKPIHIKAVAARASSFASGQQLTRPSAGTNKHRAEQHAGFDGNRDDPCDGLRAARVRR